jgi:hypothetical protein
VSFHHAAECGTRRTSKFRTTTPKPSPHLRILKVTARLSGSRFSLFHRRVGWFSFVQIAITPHPPPQPFRAHESARHHGIASICPTRASISDPAANLYSRTAILMYPSGDFQNYTSGYLK